jgi:hypothetical protein
MRKKHIGKILTSVLEGNRIIAFNTHPIILSPMFRQELQDIQDEKPSGLGFYPENLVHPVLRRKRRGIYTKGLKSAFL